MERPDLPAYEEIVGSLVDKLDGLSTVHAGLGDAAQSLVLAHLEIEDTKRRMDLLAESIERMVEQVTRLRPAELTETLDTRMAALSRESSESLSALSGRLGDVAGHVEAASGRADQRFVQIENLLAAHDEALPERLATLETSLGSSLAEAEHALTNVVTASQEKTRSALAIVLDRQDSLSQEVRRLLQLHEDLAQRHDALSQTLAGLQQGQTELSAQLAALTETLAGVRQSGEALLTHTLSLQRLTGSIEPTISAAIGATGNDLSREMARIRRWQGVSLLVILVAVALVWASLAGLVPAGGLLVR